MINRIDYLFYRGKKWKGTRKSFANEYIFGCIYLSLLYLGLAFFGLAYFCKITVWWFTGNWEGF